ncbi:hypothetical protein WMY93_005699 [Mugilogobius chulae]|uniref:Raptor N-terminal CASPase-like domain-containing protein n=1 Tax=Mugilogobius chulae TaxID=88201 RepID=A0AAW0PTD0_9GOBI
MYTVKGAHNVEARYKQSLDPTVDEVKKLCTSLRRNAKEERVLFHYNGHGVPRPTVNGEIWVFNKQLSAPPRNLPRPHCTPGPCPVSLAPHYIRDTYFWSHKNYTQYIPLSIYDLQTWMGSPSIFVYDCSNAGIIVKSFKQFALQREQELEVENKAPLLTVHFAIKFSNSPTILLYKNSTLRRAPTSLFKSSYGSVHPETCFSW